MQLNYSPEADIVIVYFTVKVFSKRYVGLKALPDKSPPDGSAFVQDGFCPFPVVENF
jgi:hypothetical protein